MDACHGIVEQIAKTLLRVALVVCAFGPNVTATAADEPSRAIRLPEWIETDSDDRVRPASLLAAPKPPALLEIEAKEPLPFPSQTTDARGVRQLEHAAGEASSEHALMRLISRYRSVRVGLQDKAMIGRADRIGSWALHARGRKRSDRKDYDGAVADYREAVRVDPANLAALHDLGISLAAQGHRDDALSAFDSVLRRSPESVEARCNRAALLILTGEAEKAVVDCDHALKQLDPSTPTHTETLILRGTALHAADRPREAARDLDAALTIQPSNAKARVSRGHVFAEAGFYEQAIADYAAALQADATVVEAYRSLAWVLATCPEDRLRDPETAIEAAWRARRLLGDDDLLTLDASAAAHAAAGEFREAVRFQQRLLMRLDDASDAARRVATRRLEAYRAGEPHVAKRPSATLERR